MATLTTRLPNGELLTHRIAKSITTIGADSGNDVVIPAAGLEPHHAQIVFDGREFSVARVDSGAPVEVNGKDKRKARLGHEDRIRLGDAEILFSVLESGAEAEGGRAGAGEIEGLRRLHAFSAKMMQKQSIEGLLEELMDAVIDLTGAAKGFLVLFEGDRPDIKVARNVLKENLDNAVSELSDSIIARVVETEEPVIVSDALNDSAFGNAESVVNLRLNSVMCVPLRERGRLMGLIYVGNDRVKNLFDMRSLELLTVFASQASLLLQNAMLVDDLKLRNVSLSEELERKRFGEIIGTSAAMREVFRQVEKVAGAEVSVLVSGETGTGKELIAREIHGRSARARGPFVSVNCGAIPESLMESEFFGHMRGAFTGAVATTTGKFQAADHGTIFLDEIGEMPLGLQVKILRVLQEHTVMKVGGTKHEPLDIRVLAATNRTLEDEIKAGRFREDLYYRLNVVHVDLPPLRSRDEDIVLLARYLLARYAAEFKSKVKGFTPNAVVSMRKHGWPGNVRELENRIKKAVILCDGAMLSAQDLDLTKDALPEVLPLAEAKERFQREYVLEVLARNNGNRTKTAKDLDVDPRTIFRYLEKV
jgi:transcriptional regulator with GAF, ATPase, and Fis domain